MKTNLRAARLEDCTFFYECRNDEEARRNARNTEYIDYSEHESWFRRTTNDSSRVLYVGEEGDEKIGVVRFNYGNPTEVAIHLHPSKRRQRYGTVLLQESIRYFIEKNLGERVLMATIRPSNIGSIKIFERARFRATGEKDPKDNGFDVYLLNLKDKNDTRK